MIEHTTYKIASFNVGQPFDFHGLVIRNGSQASDKNIASLYTGIKSTYDNAVKEFEENLSPDKKWYDHPKIKPPKASLEILNPVREEKLQAMYEAMRQECDIVLLQEVESSIDFMKTCFGKTFDFSYETTLDWAKKEVADAVVLWNNDKFKQLQIFGKEEILKKDEVQRVKTKAAVVQLLEIATGKIFNIASLHAPGYSPINKPTAKVVENGDNAVKLINTIFEASSQKLADLSLVAGDFNSESNPEYYPSEDLLNLSQARFKLLTNNGFERVPHNQVTAYNPDLADLRNGDGSCDPDHVFVKSGKNKISQITVKLGAAIEDPSTNASDHGPMFINLVI